MVRVSPFEFAPKKSLIIQLASSVDIPSLQVDPKSLVSPHTTLTMAIAPETPYRIHLCICVKRNNAKSQLPISSGMTIVTQTVPATSSPGKLSIRSRVFAPGFGVDEDPVVSLSPLSRLHMTLANPLDGIGPCLLGRLLPPHPCLRDHPGGRRSG